jgi:hypothetical protein
MASTGAAITPCCGSAAIQGWRVPDHLVRIRRRDAEEHAPGSREEAAKVVTVPKWDTLVREGQPLQRG